MYKSFKDENKIFQLQNSYAIFSVTNNMHFYLWDELLLKNSMETKMPSKWNTDRQQSHFKYWEKELWLNIIVPRFLSHHDGFWTCLVGYRDSHIFFNPGVRRVTYMKKCEALEDRKKNPHIPYMWKQVALPKKIAYVVPALTFYFSHSYK